MNCRNMWMIERGHHACLVLETRQTICVRGERSRQNLDGDIAAKLGVMGAIDIAHAAPAEERLHLIPSKPPADEQRRAGGVPEPRSHRERWTPEEVDEAFAGDWLVEQCLHLAAQLFVVPARLRKKRSTITLGARAGGVI